MEQSHENPADIKQRSFLHEFAGILKESLCWDELIIICFSCYLLHGLVAFSLSMIRLLLELYFLLSVICSLLRDSLQISPTGWKERSVLAKLACVAKAAYFSCFDIFTNMRRECSVNWEKAKEVYASMSRNDELEEKKCSWENERTDLMKQLTECHEEIRGYERRSSEMETLAMNLKQALESVEARERGCGETVDEVLGRENKLTVLFKESETQLLDERDDQQRPSRLRIYYGQSKLKEQLDESKLKIEALEEIMRTSSFEVKDQHLQIVKLSETNEKLKIERYEAVAKLCVSQCKVEEMLFELKAVKAKFEDEIKALSTEHEATKAKLEDDIKALSTEHEATKAKLEDEIKALSTVHEATKAKLEDEKNELNTKLQIANESAEFQQKLRQEYHFI